MIKIEEYRTGVPDMIFRDIQETIRSERSSDREVLEAAFAMGAFWVGDFIRSCDDQSLVFKKLPIPRTELHKAIEIPEDSGVTQEIKNQNIFLMGDPGVGKTYVTANLMKLHFCLRFIPPKRRDSKGFFGGMYSIGDSLDRFHIPPIFCSEQHILDAYSRQMSGKDENLFFASETCRYGEFDFSHLYEAPALAIQDIGSAPSHSKFLAKLFSVVDHRLSSLDKITWITTNLKIEDLKQYNKPLVDRLMSEFYTVKISGKSKRKNSIRFRGKMDPEFFVPELYAQ